MLRYIRWIAAGVILSAFALPISSARAQYLGTYVRAYVYGGDKGSGVPVVENTLQNGAPVLQNIQTFAASAVTATTTSFSGGTGDSRASADAGIVKTYSSTYFPHTDTTDYVATEARANVVDRGIITAPGLQIGDPVAMQFSMFADGVISPDPSLFLGTGGFAYMTASLVVSNVTRNINPLYLTYLWDYTTHTASLQSGIFTAFVGDEIAISCTTQAVTYINGQAPSTSATVDFGHTTHIYADGTGITPDAYLSNVASGHNYSMSVVVPEGSTALLFLPALLMGGVLVTRRLKA